jgi:hypothetical protein
MVADHAAEFGQVFQSVDTFVGVGAISDQVAQAPDFFDGRGIIENSFEGGDIGMDV